MKYTCYATVFALIHNNLNLKIWFDRQQKKVTHTIV